MKLSVEVRAMNPTVDNSLKIHSSDNTDMTQAFYAANEFCESIKRDNLDKDHFVQIVDLETNSVVARFNTLGKH